MLWLVRSNWLDPSYEIWVTLWKTAVEHLCFLSDDEHDSEQELTKTLIIHTEIILDPETTKHIYVIVCVL